MKRSLIAICFLAGLMVIGCGSDDAVKATDALTDAADSAKDAATSAVDDAVETVEDSPVKRCMELAAEKNWADALAPCTEAAKEMPDDLGIKHALQQAKAAAEG